MLQNTANQWHSNHIQMAPFKPLTLNARRRNVLSFDWLMLFSAGSVQVGYLGTAHTLEPDNTDKKT